MLGYKGAGGYGYREGRWVWLQGAIAGLVGHSYGEASLAGL